MTAHVVRMTVNAHHIIYREDGSMPEIYLKREDLNHTGAHKINNALGQALLCKRMGKTRIIAETGAGQHGVATVRWWGAGPHLGLAEAAVLQGPREQQHRHSSRSRRSRNRCWIAVKLVVQPSRDSSMQQRTSAAELRAGQPASH